MTSPERPVSEISSATFKLAVAAIARKSTLLGAESLSLKNDWGMLDLPDLDLDTIVGREAKLRGKRDGVTHSVLLRTFNGATRSNTELWGEHTKTTVADLRLHAAEGDILPNDDRDFEYSPGKGVLSGLIIFDLDRRVIADFGHGTQPSDNPLVQRRLAELVGYFGLNENIIEHQWFEYDDASVDRLIEGLSALN